MALHSNAPMWLLYAPSPNSSWGSAIWCKQLRLLGVLLVALLLSMSVLICAGLIPVAHFTGERIGITVRNEAIDVDGLYSYENPWPIPVSQGLSIPFPESTTRLPPATMAVEEVDLGTGRALRELPVYWVVGKPRFAVRISAFGSIHVRVRFTQRAATGSATYLLTTTQPWGLPLQRGEYILRPLDVRITGSNYSLDGQGHLSFVRERFMPEKEWSFTWHAE